LVEEEKVFVLFGCDEK